MSHLLQRSVLIADDEAGLRLALCANFVRHGWKAETAGSVGDSMAALDQRRFDLVVCDMRLGDGDGFAILEALRPLRERPALVFLTAFGSVPDAVRAVRHGAVDYLTKPVSFEQLMHVAQRTLARSVAAQEDPVGADGSMVGRSRALTAAVQRARVAATGDADLLIEAEAGTGKTLLARFIRSESRRRNGPFHTVCCGVLPEAKVENELFGFGPGPADDSGSYTPGCFEQAHGGTLLLKDIGAMPLRLQAGLVRVLEDRIVHRERDGRSVPADVRVLATSSGPLASLVQEGRFRADLFVRLNTSPLSLPPLRDRYDDLPLLAEHFRRVSQHNATRSLPGLNGSFVDRLSTYDWPGNLRELQLFLERVLSTAPEADLTAAAFDREHRRIVRIDDAANALTRRSSPAAQRLEDVERTHLERTLAEVGGNRTRAAELLGISVRTMRNKIRQYDLPPRRYA